jgi:hypothetical protein
MKPNLFAASVRMMNPCQDMMGGMRMANLTDQPDRATALARARLYLTNLRGLQALVARLYWSRGYLGVENARSR